jgi:polysaccharide deacetylase family protein (PEP-CTERM system associated)
MQLTNAMTVDLEDWFQGIEQPVESWHRFEERLHIGVERLLSILSETGTRATFFALGWAAERHPALLRRLVDAGHEVASHGYDHAKLYEITPRRFRDALARAKHAAEDATGQPVRGYRAPYFSLTRRSLWAIDVLFELGFTFDSSIYPGRNWRYGIPGALAQPYLLGDTGIVEFPVSIFPVGFRKVGLGGAYFRILPLWLSRRGLRKLNAAGRPAMLYVHPWELDPGHPCVRFHWKAMLTHYFNLRATAPRLRLLLRAHRFATMSAVIEALRDSLPRVALDSL